MAGSDIVSVTLVNVDDRRPAPRGQATVEDRILHLVGNISYGLIFNNIYTSVDDKNSTEAMRTLGLFISSLPKSL